MVVVIVRGNLHIYYLGFCWCAILLELLNFIIYNPNFTLYSNVSPTVTNRVAFDSRLLKLPVILHKF